MKKPIHPVLFWAPRGLVILQAAFISIFALDVFGEGYTFWQTVLALFMHLLPTFAVLIVLAIAWRWEWIGAVLLAGLGIFYIFSIGIKIHWSASLIIAGPLFLAGGLFLANWIIKTRQAHV
jgi:hypothetical protein